MEPISAPVRLSDVDATTMSTSISTSRVALPVRSTNFDAFYADAHLKVLRALALTLGDPDLAADATDEAMARAFLHWPRVSGANNPTGWVYRVGLNWATSVIRRRRHRDVLYAQHAPDLAVQSADLHDDASSSDPQLAAAVAELPVRLRAVVICRIHLDLSVEETANFLDIRSGTVKSRLARALSQLERVLGATHGTGV